MFQHSDLAAMAPKGKAQAKGKAAVKAMKTMKSAMKSMKKALAAASMSEEVFVFWCNVLPSQYVLKRT